MTRGQLRQTTHLALCALAALLLAWPGSAAPRPLPVSGRAGIRRLPLIPAPKVEARPATLPEFTSRMLNGRSNQVVGIFAPHLFALEVRQQPADSPAYVATDENAVTQFGLAERYGTIGLLAHNHLAGEAFFEMRVGTPIAVVYGDGSTAHYIVVAVERYQALEPNSPYSDFLTLDGDAGYLSSTELFYHTYTGDGELVFQTCIARDGQGSWGRFFVTARRVKSPFVGRFVRDFGERPIAFH
jgi:hypothetical protein